MSEMMKHPAWIMWEEALSEETVNEIIDLAKETEPKSASTFRSGEGEEDVSFLPPLQFTEYKDVGYHYGMHHDINWDRQDGLHRKVSLVVQLSDPEDYEGGELTFSHTQNPDPIALAKKGTVICFLSYLEHGVAPITKGNRTSLVGWAEGPRWK
jgi:predicted 2-oxoglutarate/Fe(II)-dependent dioxygenase YbiX